MTFAPNEDSKTVTVVLNDDQILENDEDLIGFLTLPGGSSGVVLGMDEATATILDDDGVCVWVCSRVTMCVGEVEIC